MTESLNYLERQTSERVTGLKMHWYIVQKISLTLHKIDKVYVIVIKSWRAWKNQLM